MNKYQKENILTSQTIRNCLLTMKGETSNGIACDITPRTLLLSN